MMHLFRSGALLAAVALVAVGLVAPTQAQDPANGFNVYVPVVRGGAAPGANLTPSNNLPVMTATFLGGAGSDAAGGVDVALDGAIVFGGTLPGHTPGGVTPVTLPGGGNGAVVRFGPDGRTVLSATRIGGAVSDLEVAADGRIAVCGDFGVALLNADASAAAWSAAPGSASRCAVGSDGVVAALVGGSAFVYASDGALLKNWSIGGNGQSDLAVDGANRLVIAVGYTQVSSNLQIAFMRAWDYAGTLRWRSYDFPDAPGLGADTRGERVAIGRDGKLYFAGSINGGTGASIFSRDPKDINLRLGSDRNVATDTFNNATNTGSVKMTWFGRYNPADGALELGSSLLTRLSDGKGNSIVARAIAADEMGRVYLAGDSSCCLQNRSARQVAGITVGAYEGGEGFFLALSADFKQRLIWTPFAAPGASAGGSPAVGVAVRNGRVAIVVNANAKDGARREWITHNPLQASPATLPDAYLAVWQQ